MPLVPAKCPECGGNINIDPDKKAAVCEFCKQPFIVEEAINNFNTTYNITNHNDIKADVVNVYESKTSDFVIRAGELVEYTGESADVIVPNSVSSIGFRAFLNNKICSIKCPSSVKKIRERAFEGCTELRFVIFEAETIETGPDIFAYCNSIETILHNTFEFKNVVSWENYRESNYKDAEFCFSMKNFDNENGFPVVIKKIGNYGSKNFKRLEIIPSFNSIIIPESVYELGDGAFYGYSNLESINLPMGLKIIGEYAFYGCDSLNSIRIPGSVRKISSFAFCNCKSLETVAIEEGVEIIDSYAFIGCESLIKVSLPNSVRVIECSAFSGDSYFDDPGYLRKLSVVEAPESLIRKNISAFDINSPFVSKMALKYCQKCGGNYKGIFNKVCENCGYKR